MLLQAVEEGRAVSVLAQVDLAHFEEEVLVGFATALRAKCRILFDLVSADAKLAHHLFHLVGNLLLRLDLGVEKAAEEDERGFLVGRAHLTTFKVGLEKVDGFL